MSFDPWDFYNKKAKSEGYKARAFYKLDEIQSKYKIFDRKTSKVLDLGCAPGSRLQASVKYMKNKNICAIGIDLKEVFLSLQGVHTYVGDITDIELVSGLCEKHSVNLFDVILSDAAPNTTGIKDIDAMKSISLIQDTLPIYKRFLSPYGKFVVKVFMGSGFDDLVGSFKHIYGAKNIKVYKPDASRKQSKEVYIIKYK